MKLVVLGMECLPLAKGLESSKDGLLSSGSAGYCDISDVIWQGTVKVPGIVEAFTELENA